MAPGRPARPVHLGEKPGAWPQTVSGRMSPGRARCPSVASARSAATRMRARAALGSSTRAVAGELFEIVADMEGARLRCASCFQIIERDLRSRRLPEDGGPGAADQARADNGDLGHARPSAGVRYNLSPHPEERSVEVASRRMVQPLPRFLDASFETLLRSSSRMRAVCGYATRAAAQRAERTARGSLNSGAREVPVWVTLAAFGHDGAVGERKREIEMVVDDHDGDLHRRSLSKASNSSSTTAGASPSKKARRAAAPWCRRTGPGRRHHLLFATGEVDRPGNASAA